MARGNSTASNAATTASNNSQSLMGNAGAIYSDIVPTLESQAANPQGFNPADEARMETGAMQSAGGATAGAVGQGGLEAARTRNAGAGEKAIADSARTAGQTLSKNLLGIRSANANLKNNQRQSALGDLSGLYGTTLGGSTGQLGQVAPLVNANTQAANESWDWAKFVLDPAMQAAGTAAAGA